MVDIVRDRLDKQLAQDGIWKEIEGFGEVKLRRWNNPEYRKLGVELRDLKLEELGLGPEGTMDDETAFKVMVETACHTVIVDWRGIESDGEPLPYSPEVGIAVFNDEDDAWRDEFYLIVAAASDRNNYVQKRLEANVKKP